MRVWVCSRWKGRTAVVTVTQRVHAPTDSDRLKTVSPRQAQIDLLRTDLEAPESEVIKIDGKTSVVRPIGGGALQFAADRELWDMQPGEPIAHFTAFVTYRDMEPLKRSLSNAWRLQHGKDFPEYHVPDTWGRWSKEWRWADRASAYDIYIDRQLRTQLEQRRLKSRVETAQLGQLMREKALEALKVLRSTLYEIRVENGKRVKVLRSALTPSQITRLAEVGAKLERLALGEPTEISEISGMVGVAHAHAVRFTDEDLITRASEIIRSRAIDAPETS